MIKTAKVLVEKKRLEAMKTVNTYHPQDDIISQAKRVHPNDIHKTGYDNLQGLFYIKKILANLFLLSPTDC